VVYCVQLLWCGLGIVADSHRADILNPTVSRCISIRSIRLNQTSSVARLRFWVRRSSACGAGHQSVGLTHIGTTTTALNTQRQTSNCEDNSDLCFTGAWHSAAEPQRDAVEADSCEDLQKSEKPSLPRRFGT